VQLNNYATTLRLAHSETLSRQVRRGWIEDEIIPFSWFEWLGHRWLTAYASPLPLPVWISDDMVANAFTMRVSRSPVFALESSIALHVLATLVDYPEQLERFNIEPIDRRFMQLARAESGGGGAVFRDGLATVTNRNWIKETRFAGWRRDKRAITGSAY
jgi:hypothetical protein